MNIRKIEIRDNAEIAAVIRTIFHELNAPKVGTAYADPLLDTLYEVYNNERFIYLVVENEGKILGGCGIAPLANEANHICELQKMYFAPEIRGSGLASQIINDCLKFAKENEYTLCYLETLSFMKAAQNLYKNLGFENISEPMGNTGHNSCEVWMTKKIE